MIIDLRSNSAVSVVYLFKPKKESAAQLIEKTEPLKKHTIIKTNRRRIKKKLDIYRKAA